MTIRNRKPPLRIISLSSPGIRQRYLQQVIASAKREWEVTVDALGEFVALLNERGIVIRCNRTIERWGIFSVKRAKGKPLHLLFHPLCKDPDCYFRELMSSLLELRSGQEQRWEGYDSWLGRYGLVHLYPLKLPFRSPISQASAVFVFSDISEEYLLKEAMARRNELLAFLQTISRSRPSEDSLDRPLRELFAFAQRVIGFDSLLFFSLSEKREVEVIFYHQGEFLPLEKIELFAGASELYYTFQNHPQGLPQGEFVQEGVSLYGVLLGEKGDLDYLALARSSPWGTHDIELIRFFTSGVEGLLLGVKLEKERIHRQALEVANLFTHQSAHEVRNYLTSLNFFLELLKEEELSPEVKEFSQRLIQHGNKVHRLINDMLSLTRPVREERIELFNLCDLLKGSVRVWGETHPGAKIDPFLPEGGSWDVKGDRMRIEEAVYNLLQNAFEASLPGSSIRLSLHLSPDENAVITIEDEGPGIPPEVFPRLFTPFFTTKAQGSGLGLTIVKRIIEGHGGTVFLANRPQGKGAVATIILPLALR